jgi:Fe-S cluster assembly protein SufD
VPVPSPLEEDWRKTDPDAFPFVRLEETDPERSRIEISLRDLSEGALPGLVPLTSVRDVPMCRGLQAVPGDDYDAKFLYYHKAFSRTPACFRVPRGFRGDAVELVQRAVGPGLAPFTTILFVEAGAEVTFYDRWEVGSEAAAAIGRTEIVVGEGAHLTYLQEDDAGESGFFYRRARVRIDRNARLSWFAATPGAGWHAARLDMVMNGPGSEARFKGLFAGRGAARADHRTHQHHASPQAKSELTFKTLLSGSAHSVYQGLITVPRDAQQTDAYQQCRNLLLDPGAHADAIPKLEIIADDVRCTHGASMGSVNKDQLFYLQSRGLTRRQATTAIATGFAEEVIRDVPVESVRERWRSLVAKTIGAA